MSDVHGEADMERGRGNHRRVTGAKLAKLRFRITAYSPTTMPMVRLARYLNNLSTVLGESNSVHLVSVEDGSTVPVLVIDPKAYPSVRQRVDNVRNCRGSKRALTARQAIESDLVADNAEYGDLVDENGACILRFAGETRASHPEYGPFSEHGTLDGVPVVVGGLNDPVPVHLQNQEQVHICHAKRSLAKQIGMHLFSTPLRVSGIGRWFRDREGEWSMKSFRIHEFIELQSESLAQATRALQSIDAGWKKTADPLGDLIALRKLDG